MKMWIAIVGVMAGVLGAGDTWAQQMRTGPGNVEVTFAPVGGSFFREAGESIEPGFGSYDLGASLTLNFNRHIGIEAELGGTLGVTQDLVFAGETSSHRPPHMLTYGGSLVFSMPNRTSFVPYVAGGLGGLTLFERASLEVNETESFLTGNVGGGLKWYGGRWGLRGDYRLVSVRSKDDAPEFFGRQTRYGHRLYAGILLSLR